MKTVAWIGSMSAIAALAAFAAHADTEKTPQQIMERAEARLAGLANEMNRECGSSITARFDWSGLLPDMAGDNSPTGWCSSALDGIRDVCADNPGKEAVREKIKTLTCAFGPERSISLKDGVVDFKINFKSSNDAKFVFESLENAL
jgi:hypothetical protein